MSDLNCVTFLDKQPAQPARTTRQDPQWRVFRCDSDRYLDYVGVLHEPTQPE
ncbi:MAG: hypothetical protein ACKVU2_11640 [Saprospiraceae bacterium]